MAYWKRSKTAKLEKSATNSLTWSFARTNATNLVFAIYCAAKYFMPMDLVGSVWDCDGETYTIKKSKYGSIAECRITTAHCAPGSATLESKQQLDLRLAKTCSGSETIR